MIAVGLWAPRCAVFSAATVNRLDAIRDSEQISSCNTSLTPEGFDCFSQFAAWPLSAMESVPGPPRFLTETLSPVFEQGCSDAISLIPLDGSAATPTPASPDPSRPFVTLTFAQSLDAKIAGQGGTQLALSGRKSLVMTHWCV